MSEAYKDREDTRTNEYFVPKDGIDREVITADICRYLGNEALVRPGNYEVWLLLDSTETVDEQTADGSASRTRKPDKFSKATSLPHTETSQL
jgi:hypothetical protein